MQYSYPFYPYALAVQGTPNATTNTLFHQRDLVTADDTWVVRPNVDTLYSRSFLDLSSFDLEITIPEISDRYWVSCIPKTSTYEYESCFSLGCSANGIYLALALL